MGIDAKMYVKLFNPVFPDEIKRKSYIFGQAFSQHLMIGFDDKIYYHPLETKKEDYEENEDWWDIKIPLAGRYYGIGYERGPLFIYIAIAEMLEKLFPYCTIYYDGDSGGTERVVFNKDTRDELVEHFINHGGRDPYNRAFDRENDGPECPVCEVKMIRNGWGPNYALWTCSGCGWIESKRGDVTKKGFNIKYNE